MLRRSLPGELLRSLCGPQGTGEGGAAGERPLLAGGHGRGGTPGPVPNPEVKPPSADGTAEEVRGRAGRRRPTRGVFLFPHSEGRAPARQDGARGPFSCAHGGFFRFSRVQDGLHAWRGAPWATGTAALGSFFPPQKVEGAGGLRFFDGASSTSTWIHRGCVGVSSEADLCQGLFLGSVNGLLDLLMYPLLYNNVDGFIGRLFLADG